MRIATMSRDRPDSQCEDQTHTLCVSVSLSLYALLLATFLFFKSGLSLRYMLHGKTRGKHFYNRFPTV